MMHKYLINGPIGLFMIAGCVAEASAAEAVLVYRCQYDGKIEFQQIPCQAGDETLLPVTDHSGGLSPSEPGLRLPRPAHKAGKHSGRKPRGASERQCWKKQQQLSRVERRLRAGYRASQYQSLHDRQREYEAFIRRFCRR
jgi:hypothetical protein